MASVVQSVGNNNGGGATTLAFTVSAVGASQRVLVVQVGARGTHTIAASGVSDNVGGTTGWVIKNPSGGSENPASLATNKPAFAYHLSPPSGLTTVTVTLDSSGVAGGFCTEVNIGANTPTFSACVISDNGSVAVTSWTSTSLSLAAAGFGLGISNLGTTGITMTAGSGWTALSGTGITSGSNTNGTDADQVFGEFQNIASGGSYAATGTSDSAAQNSGMILFNLVASTVSDPIRRRFPMSILQH